MMKDQYANYVIQKILQKCTSDQRELLLGIIRNHLTALKKYTYGKHIVTRLEQAYGEGKCSFFFVLHFLPTLFRFRYLKWPHIWCDFVLVLLYWIPCFNFSSFLLVNDQFLIIYSYDWRRWPLPSFLVLAILPLKRRETSIDMLNLWILTLSFVFISPIDIISSRSFRNSIIRTIGTWAVFIPMIDCLCCVSCKLPTSFQRMMLTDVVPGSANNPPQKSSALGCLHM